MINELKIQELKDMFFYTFGIVPLQNYGAIGDGITDNRLKIQQAIYDAIEVGTRYIFVPKGNYYYSNLLFKTDEVIFVGNNIDAYIKGIEIKAFPDIYNNVESNTIISVPIGGIIDFAGTEIPNGYLECNGQTYSNVDYPRLYNVLNNTTVPTLSSSQNNIKKIIRAK